MKNDIFNFRRFGRYFVSDIKTCYANFGLSLIVSCLSATLLVYALTVFFNLMTAHAWMGPTSAIRLAALIIMFFVIVINGPSKCYGNITDKQYGSFWLTLPASRLEKFVSMVLISAVIIPVVSLATFLGIDALTCWIDPTCGQSVASSIGHVASQIVSFDISEAISDEIPAEVTRFIDQLSSPWLYMDDFFGMTLPFLLGALVFKKNKAAKTILALIVISAALSIIATPITAAWGKDLIATINMTEGTAGISELFNSWIFRNIALLDALSDTIVNLILLTAIYFRIKTITH